jgi:hypothetical protein
MHTVFKIKSPLYLVFSNVYYRSTNTQRRRRKRPRPQPPDDEIKFPSPTLTEGPEATALPHKKQTTYYQAPEVPQLGYSYETSAGNVETIRKSQILPFNSQQHHARPQRRRPNSSRHRLQSHDLSGTPVRVNSADIQVTTEDDVYHNKNEKPHEQVINLSQEEQDKNYNDNSHSDSHSFVTENSYTNNENGDDKHGLSHGSVSEDVKLQQNAYRKPYPSRFGGNNNDAVVSPQDIKALLKQQPGSLSLSELLQQKNLSLADLLKGNRNALSALTGAHNAVPRDSKTAETNQELVHPRRLPPQTNSRRKSQSTNHRKPPRYPDIQEPISEHPDLESNKHKQLPAVNSPSWRIQPSVGTDKLLKHQVHELQKTESDNTEHINKFVPSSPRRPQLLEVKLATDTTLTSSTERNEVTKLILPEDHNIFPDSLPRDYEEKHDETQLLNKQDNNLHTVTSATEHNIIVNPPVPDSFQKNSQGVDTNKKHPTTDHKDVPIPLNIQETSVIDPLQNPPETDTVDQKVVDHNRIRGKYIPRHRISTSDRNSSSKVDTIKTGRVRLPPPNLFLSVLRLTESNQMSTKDMLQSIQFISTMPTTHTTDKTVTLTEESKELAIKQIQSMSPQVQHGDSLPGDQVTGLTTEIISSTDGENKDEPLHKVIQFQPEPLSSQSEGINENNEAKITSARDEILEFLKTDTGSVHLARILASRNMTLAELIEHRVRGSSQQHLADIFRESGQPISQPTEANKSDSHENESNHDLINNEIKNYVIRNVQQDNTNNIPSIQEMFTFLTDSHTEPLDHEMNQETASTSTQEQTQSGNPEDPQQTSLSDPLVSDTLPAFHPNPPLYIPPVPNLRPSNPNLHSIPSWKISYQHPAFDPANPHISPGRSPIITSRLTTPILPTPLTNNGITHSIVLLENIGQVREVASSGVEGIKGPIKFNKLENQQLDVLYRGDIDDHELDSELQTDVKSTIIVSSAILGPAILGFLAIFVVCRWRQKQARRRFVAGIVSTTPHSPILKQTEDKNICQSLSPVMVNTRDLYKTGVSLDGEDDNQHQGARRYYLWRTIRKTLRYK